MRRPVAFLKVTFQRHVRPLFSWRYYDFRCAEGVFPFKILLLLVLLIGLAAWVAVAHARCPAPVWSDSIAGEVKPNTDCIAGHGEFLVLGSLSIAFGFVTFMTLVQYFGTLSLSRERGYDHRCNLYFVGAVLVIGAIACYEVTSAWASNAESKFAAFLAIPILSLFFPSVKNVIVALIAFILWRVDESESSFKKYAAMDKAIFASVILSSMLIGVAGQSSLGREFMKAFNAGVVAFHLILGTLLFEGTVSDPQGSPGSVQNSRPRG